MFKALLKKQLTEVLSVFIRDRKTGGLREKKGAILYVVIFALLFVFIAFAFGGLAYTFLPFLATPYPWLYFALLGAMTVLYGILGSIFNTYAGLYHAKDNDLLLSMPIPPRMIIAVRATGVAAMAILYGSMVLVPTIVVRFIGGGITVRGAVFMILLEILAPLFVTALACILGWVVAIVASKLKNKSFLTVILCLAILGIYFYFCGNMSSFTDMLLNNSEAVAGKVRIWLWPFWLMGRGVEGDVPAMLGFAAITAALTGVTVLVLTKTFTKIVTTKESGKKKTVKASSAKSAGVDRALLRRERMKLTSSPTYMMNCCLGSVFMILAGVIVIVKKDAIAQVIGAMGMMMPEAGGFLPVVAMSAVLLLCGSNTLTAPSVSLEGKNIWIAQSLPVDPARVLYAKMGLHVLVTAVPGVIAAVCIGYAMQCSATEIVFTCVAAVVFTELMASLGVILDLKHPTLVWTNETVPVKQSLSVVIVMFGGWIAAVGLAALYYPLRKTVDASTYIILLAVVLAVICRLLRSWIAGRGAKIYSAL